MVLTAIIILFLVYRRKPWATFDSELDKIELKGKQLPNFISQSIYCLGIVFILIIDWVNIILDTLYIGFESFANTFCCSKSFIMKLLQQCCRSCSPGS